MAKLDIFNLKREKVGELDLADEVFAAEVKEHLFHEVVTAQLASARAGTRAARNARLCAARPRRSTSKKARVARATARSARRSSSGAAARIRRSRKT